MPLNFTQAQRLSQYCVLYRGTLIQQEGPSLKRNQALGAARERKAQKEDLFREQERLLRILHDQET